MTILQEASGREGGSEMVQHQWYSDETHEKEMKQLHFSPWYKNISRANLFHISVLRSPLVHRLLVNRQTRRCGCTKPTPGCLAEQRFGSSHASWQQAAALGFVWGGSCLPGVSPFSWEPFPQQRSRWKEGFLCLTALPVGFSVKYKISGLFLFV